MSASTLPPLILLLSLHLSPTTQPALCSPAELLRVKKRCLYKIQGNHHSSSERTNAFQWTADLHLTWNRSQALSSAFQLAQLAGRYLSPDQVPPDALHLCYESGWADSAPPDKSYRHLHPRNTSIKQYCSTCSPDLYLVCKYKQKEIGPEKYTSSWVPCVWHNLFFIR